MTLSPVRLKFHKITQTSTAKDVNLLNSVIVARVQPRTSKGITGPVIASELPPFIVKR